MSTQAPGSSEASPATTAARRLGTEVRVEGFRCPLIASTRDSSSCDTLFSHLAHSPPSAS